MDIYPAVKPEATLDEIVDVLSSFGQNRQVRVRVEQENAQGYSRALLWGIANPDESWSKLFYKPEVDREAEATEDYAHHNLRAHLQQLLLESESNPELYEIRVEIPYPDPSLAPAAAISWNMGRGKILLGRLH